MTTRGVLFNGCFRGRGCSACTRGTLAAFLFVAPLLVPDSHVLGGALSVRSFCLQNLRF